MHVGICGQALAVMARPSNAAGSVVLLVDSVDAICQIVDSGSGSETERLQRRAMATAVYSATGERGMSSEGAPITHHSQSGDQPIKPVGPSYS